MWSSFFSWATDMTDRCSTDDFAQFFRDYFMDSGVCGEVLGLSALIALVFTFVFYFGIGKFSFTLSKRITWIVFLVISSVTIYYVSDYYIIGTDSGDLDNSTGLYKASYKTEKKLTENNKSTDLNKVIHKNARKYRNKFKEDNVSLPHRMAGLNSVYGLILFILFSLGAKRFSRHAKYIPLKL